MKRDFYFRIADEAPVDVVYVGEVVCSKRAPFFNPHLPLVMERTGGCASYLFEEPTSLNVIALLPELIEAGGRRRRLAARGRIEGEAECGYHPPPAPI